MIQCIEVISNVGVAACKKGRLVSLLPPSPSMLSKSASDGPSTLGERRSSRSRILQVDTCSQHPRIQAVTNPERDLGVMVVISVKISTQCAIAVNKWDSRGLGAFPEFVFALGTAETCIFELWFIYIYKYNLSRQWRGFQHSHLNIILGSCLRSSRN